MAIVEEVPEDEPRQLHTTNKTELQHAIRALSARLALPEDLLPGFLNEEKAPEYTTLYRDRAEDVLREWLDISKSSAWKELAVEEQGEVFGQITRLYGDDEWTSRDIMTLIDGISTSVDTKPLAVHLLCHTLRPLFSASHPMLNPSTSRALSRPTGGPEALSDMHDTAAQIWKSPTAWGSYNILAWCTTHLPPSDITDHLGSILPPTLMMMDDWEPAWRGRGVWVLGKWVEAVPTQTMQRMGMDKLLLKSLLHTLSLHPNPPLPHVMPSTLDLIMRTSEGEKRADWIVEIMDKAILTGWMYAPSGAEGRPVLVQIAKDLEMVCEVIGTDIIRWLKSIIPNLLQPLSYHPTPAVLPHFEANLSALICIIKCVLSTGRIDRWRGQIIDVISRLCVHIDERNREVEVVEYSPGQKAVMFEGLERSAREVYDLLFTACPSVRENEYQRLINVDQQVFERILRSVYTSA